MKTKPHILVVGSGLAGMYFSLRASAFAKITLVCKELLTDSNTCQAQGGIAAAIGGTDSIEKHLADTLTAGDGLCDAVVAENILKQAPEIIATLQSYGVDFTKNPDQSLNLSREGGHSDARVIHAQDQTGRKLITRLAELVTAHPDIDVLEQTQAIDLYTNENRCMGAWVISKQHQELQLLGSDFTVLATGGAAAIYRQHTNPEGATGDGYAMAWRAGVELNNMEFVQFHPTMFYNRSGNAFLISETVRGFGAELKLPDGKTFMEQYHPMGSLAPRDIVAKGIKKQMDLNRLPCVFLDTTIFSETQLRDKFPYIFSRCLEHGINPAKEMIPVLPAAHYFCGGIATNDKGETTLPGLFALGESACTGLHGANRLASNSLLEAMVMAESCMKTCETNLREWSGFRTSPKTAVCSVPASHNLNGKLAEMKAELQNMMWTFCGILRSETSLKLLCTFLKNQIHEVKTMITDSGLSVELTEHLNRVQTALLVADAALGRKESRGCHLRRDFPQKNKITTKSVSRHPEKESLIDLLHETIAYSL